MRFLRTHLTYANVIATLALFLALGGGVAWAAGRIGAKQLKTNSVTAAKIKGGSVTTDKLADGAVTRAKLAAGVLAEAGRAEAGIGDGAVTFAKLASGANIVASAAGGPVAVNLTEAGTVIPLAGTDSFVPRAGVTNLLNVEARGIDLAGKAGNTCEPSVLPLVNGQLFEVSSGLLGLSSAASVPTEFRPVTLDAESGPVGLGTPGVPQQISVKVLGDLDCAPGSKVAVAISVIQLK